MQFFVNLWPNFIYFSDILDSDKVVVLGNPFIIDMKKYINYEFKRNVYYTAKSFDVNVTIFNGVLSIQKTDIAKCLLDNSETLVFINVTAFGLGSIFNFTVIDLLILCQSPYFNLTQDFNCIVDDLCLISLNPYIFPSFTFITNFSFFGLPSGILASSSSLT